MNTRIRKPNQEGSTIVTSKTGTTYNIKYQDEPVRGWTAIYNTDGEVDTLGIFRSKTDAINAAIGDGK